MCKSILMFFCLSFWVSATAQISPDSIAGLGIVHKEYIEWGKVAGIEISVLNITNNAGTSRYLRMDWVVGVSTSYKHRVAISCEQAREYLTALEGFLKVCEGIPSTGHEYAFQHRNNDLILTLYASAPPAWKLAVECDDCYGNGSLTLSLANLQSLIAYFKDFVAKC